MRVLAKDRYAMASRRREGPTLFKITLPLHKLRPASKLEAVGNMARMEKDVNKNAFLDQTLTGEDAASSSSSCGARPRSIVGEFRFQGHPDIIDDNETGEDKTDDEGVCMATCASPKRVRAQRNMRRAFGQGHRAAMNHSSAWWHEDSFTRSRHTGEVLQRFSPRQQIWSAPDPLPLHVLPRTEMER
ncbi:hypothetical protein BBK36DRAFT_1174853 [Trichoderma citrinoviride]|uniref:Uncharacterized protein n=1 Tax=Trichoderma citrinoviride TaxID=58853 RepID=A0A2T4BMR0_9HYPO|nr:hypothetical protein BBK36DRAFT_1174853 [Trichoderma citrinoviride]PTB70598.1 hypothetical protein BBK36DRAFT_1174853 [Trichoderma citrinoviride]